MTSTRKRYVLTLLLLSLLAVGGAAAWWLPEEAIEPKPVSLVAAEPGLNERVEPAEDLAADEEGFSEGRAGFAVQVKDEVIPYRVFGLFVMPGEAVEIEAVFTQGTGNVAFEAPEGAAEQTGPETWRWTAPGAPGLYPVTITDTRAGETITLNVFVKTPFDHRSQSLNGYRIGDYADEPLRGNPVYDEPAGFVEVTPENRHVPVSPHFTLGQFLCKQEAGWPRYVLIRERLLLKLEMLVQEVNELGIPAQTLHVMSAYRTPYYNRSIGNTTTYSRHLYGGAADVFVDLDGDGTMDDLTGDGAVTVADARAMAAIVEEATEETWYQPFVGGLGIYAPAPHRGPFIHVDVRGQKARW
ncbi:MAG: D-Ala-D-Ala carboxypeptidase family metallohydrolase [Rhodothermales bacterium]|nr:D-Ala-D-Ala carboxypeptidase family metallohydrolase [Rhodothermales bacterium]